MDNIISGKNQSISLIRVVSMLMIIICHILNEFNSTAFLGQVFNVGVFIFIFTSGFLYGKKDINNTRKWLFKRAARILLPMYIFMIFLFFIRIIFLHEIDYLYYFVYLVNLQGILGAVKGAEHLWFLTLIMICYLITPLLNSIKNKVRALTKIKFLIIFIMLIVTQLISTYFINKKLGLYLAYSLLYIFAYFSSSLETRKISKKGLISYTLVSTSAVMIRLVAKFITDGSIIYDYFIVIYTQSILGIWIFITITYFQRLVSNNLINKTINHLDKISFEIYIVHYMFIVGPLRMISFTKNFFANIIMLLLLIYVVGVILHKVTSIIFNTKFNLSVNHQKLPKNLT